MAFNLIGYRDKYKDFFQGASLEEVARDAYEVGGYAKTHGDFETWKKAAGIDADIVADNNNRKPFEQRLKEGTDSVAPTKILKSFLQGGAEGLTTELPSMVGGALEFAGSYLPGEGIEKTGKSIKDWAEEKREDLYGPEVERTGLDRIVYEGTKMLAPSIIPGGIAVTGARMIKGVSALQKAGKFAEAASAAKMANNIGGGAAAALFGLSQAQQTRDTAIKQAEELEAQGNFAEAQKIRESGYGVAPIATGAIEALGEFLGTKYLGKLFGVDEAEIVKKSVKAFTVDLLKTIGVEVGTEMGQSSGESAIEKYSGIRPNAEPLQEAMDVIGPTTFMTLLTGGIAGAANKMRSQDPKEREAAAHLDQLKKGALLSMAIHDGLKTGQYEGQPFTKANALELMKAGQEDGLFSSEDLDRFHERYPALKTEINDVLVDSLKDQITQAVRPEVEATKKIIQTRNTEEDVPVNLGEGVIDNGQMQTETTIAPAETAPTAPAAGTDYQAEAEKHGAKFNGIQKGYKNIPDKPMFTADIDGVPTTFTLDENETLPQAIERKLAQKREFEAKEPISTKQGISPVVEIPVNKIKLSKDVPQFKGDANEKGVVQELQGKEYRRVPMNAVILWQRKNGDLEIITGRHRWDLAKRLGEKTIPSQIVKESEGFDRQRALTFDAEQNILDNQGTEKDYANYFRNTDISEEEARSRGLLRGTKASAAWLLGKNATDQTFNSYFRTGEINFRQAVAVAKAAPNDERLQLAGRSFVTKNPRSTDTEVENFVHALSLVKDAPKQVQGDLFGFDDSAIRTAEMQAKKAAAIIGRLRRDSSNINAAIRGEGKLELSEEGAKEYGIKDPKNKEQLKTARNKILSKIGEWEKWYVNPELVKQLTEGQEAVEPKAAVATKKPPQIVPHPDGDGFAVSVGENRWVSGGAGPLGGGSIGKWATIDEAKNGARHLKNVEVSPEAAVKAEPKTEKTEVGDQAVIPGASAAETFSLTNPETEISKPLPQQITPKNEDLFGEKTNNEAKEPWQMRVQDYSDYEADIMGQQKKPVSERTIAWHRGKVRDAIAEGKPVPPEVLQDYPELRKKAEPAYGTTNKIFTEDKAAKARAILKAKLNGTQLNMGLDPEIISAGIDLAGYHIEAGARSFAAYAERMIADIGENIRPYLKSFYLAVRNYPGFDNKGMNTEAELDEIGEKNVILEEKKPHEYGKEAFTKGLKAIPAQDAAFMDFYQFINNPDEKVKAMKEWMRGWTEVNLAPPAARPAENKTIIVLPPKDQKKGGPYYIAKLLQSHNLLDQIMKDEDFYRKIQNPPYQDLTIERHGDDLYFTHYYKQNGDLIMDGEMVWTVDNKGMLSLKETAVQNPIRGGELRSRDISFANIFSRNLIHQGFENGKLINPREEGKPENKTVAPYNIVADNVYYNLRANVKFTRNELFSMCKDAFGGTLAEGKFSAKDAYDAMEMGINKYLLETLVTPHGTHGEERYAKSRIKDLKELFELIPTQTTRTEEMDEFQQFSTPPAQAYAANWVANLKKDDSYLEPSAGTGNLAIFAKIFGTKETIVNELAPRRAEILKELGFDRVFTENAEQINNILPKDVKPTVVVMNPPFSSTAGRMKGERKTINATVHIEQALKRLQPGGRLVAIVGEGMADDRPAFKSWWQKIEGDYIVRANVGISGQEYAKYGTTFDNQIIVIDKPLDQSNKESIIKVTGKVDKIEQLIDLLSGVRNERIDTGKRESVEQGEQKSPAGTETKTGRNESLQPTTGGVVTETQPGRPGRTPDANTGRNEGLGTGKRGEVSGTQSGNTGTGRPGAVESGKGQPQGTGRSNTSDDTRQADNAPSAVPTEAVESLTVEQRAEIEKHSDELSDSVYDTYRPAKVKIPNAKEHPGKLVESAAMASIDPIDPKYSPRLPESAVKSGKISIAQLEAVVYAGQAHSEMLPNGRRKGFFIGDGTGVGKGREIASILWDNWNQGRHKAVWVSQNSPLMKDAERDIKGVGWDPGLLFDIGKAKLQGGIQAKEGIGFVGYGTLRSKKVIEGREISRLNQLVEWFGKDYDGVIVFDESHNMGNALPVKGQRGTTKPSATALAGVELQKLLPQARIVYVSATGATEVMNLAYAERLGLWGDKTPFPNALSFVTSISAGGISAMEMVAMNMKANGVYMARSLAYDDVKYERLEHPLTTEQRAIYDELAAAWQIAQDDINSAMAVTGITGVGHTGDTKTLNTDAKSHIMAQFWGTNQRFWNQVITAMQMPTVIKAIDADLKIGHAPLVQLINTNEAAQERAIGRLEEEDSLEDLDITPRDMLIEYVNNSFPVYQFEKYTDDEGNEKSRLVVDSQGNPVLNAEAVAMRDELLTKIGSIRVPDGPLEMILDHFGVDVVSEVTGRSRRVVYKDTPEGRKRVVESWGKNKGMADADAFMADKKKILVFSQAGGTGRSYHADRTAKNKRLRRHYLVQAGWRADVAVQGLGRSHRTNQEQAPEWVLVATDLEGQKRFISSIARRLSQLGALTKGSRETGNQGLFNSRDNLESQEAKDAFHQLLNDLYHNEVPDMTMGEFIEATGLNNIINQETGALNISQLPEITQFLNRILNMKIEQQNHIFGEFSKRLNMKVARAIEDGTLDVGVETIRAKKTEKANEQVVYQDEKTNAQAKYIEVALTHDAKLMTFPQSAAYSMYGYVQNIKSGRIWALANQRNKTNAVTGEIENQYSAVGANYNYHVIAESDTKNPEKYREIPRAQAEALWNADYEAAPKEIKESVHMITGTILPIWDRLPTGQARIYRLNVDGKNIIGRVIDRRDLERTLQKLGATRKATTFKPEDIFNNVLNRGYAYTLSNDWTIGRRKVADDYRIEIKGPSYSNLDELRKYGVFTERISYETRFFIPADTETGINAIKEIISSRPVVDEVAAGKKAGQVTAKDAAFMNEMGELIVREIEGGYGLDNMAERAYNYDQGDNENAISDGGLQDRDGRNTGERAGVSYQKTVVGREKVGTIKTKSKVIKSARDAASLAAQYLKKYPDEHFISIVMGKRGNVLHVFRHTIGLPNATQGAASIIAGDALNTPGAAYVIIAHNHPSQDPSFSPEDRKFPSRIKNLLAGSGVELKDAITVTQTQYASYLEDGGYYPGGTIEDGTGNVSIPMMGRVFEAIHNGEKIKDSESAISVAKKYIPDGGVLILDGQNRVAGTSEITEFSNIRGERQRELLQEIEKRNALGVIVYLPSRQIELNEAQNMVNFMGAASVRLVDIIDIEGSLREDGKLPPKNSDVFYKIVHHGTPHIWPPEPGFPHGRPRLDKIGTGEGAAAYGRGWYSAEAEDVGKTYLVSTGDLPRYIGIMRELAAMQDRVNTVSVAGNTESLYGAANRIADNDFDFIKALPEEIKDRITKTEGGSLYKLDIPDDVIPKLLDWDKPLSEQSEYVKKALVPVRRDDRFDLDPAAGTDVETGMTAYARIAGVLGSQKAASEYLASIGIPGNKYLDGMSRGQGEGSYNFVIWDQKVLDRIALLERNGEKLDAIREAQLNVSKQTGGSFTPTIEDVRKVFPGQRIEQTEKGLMVRVNNNTLLIENVDRIDVNTFALNIGYGKGQLSKGDVVAGKYEKGIISLVKDSASKFTLAHESVHYMEDLGIINGQDVTALKNHINAMVRDGKFQTRNNKDVGGAEDRADFIAKTLLEEPNGFIGRIIKKIQDFVDRIVNAFGIRTAAGVVRDIKNGKLLTEANGRGIIKHEGEKTYETPMDAGRTEATRQPDAGRPGQNEQVYGRSGTTEGLTDRETEEVLDNLRDDVADAFLYHATYKEKLRSIFREGLNPNAAGDYAYLDGKGNRVFLAPDTELAYEFGDILLRVPVSKLNPNQLKYKELRIGEEAHYFNSVSPYDLEVFVTGEWEPLRERYSIVDQADTPAFKKWFGNSKVVDENGKPLVVYHGTQADFNSFDPDKIGTETDQGQFGRGFYFHVKHGAGTKWGGTAGGYAAGTNGNIMPVYVSIKNPYITHQALWGRAIPEGHDGVIVLDKPNGKIDEVVAFFPTQIKSAIGNRGAFDGSNPDIRYSISNKKGGLVEKEINLVKERYAEDGRTFPDDIEIVTSGTREKELFGLYGLPNSSPNYKGGYFGDSASIFYDDETGDPKAFVPSRAALKGDGTPFIERQLTENEIKSKEEWKKKNIYSPEEYAKIKEASRAGQYSIQRPQDPPASKDPKVLNLYLKDEADAIKQTILNKLHPKQMTWLETMLKSPEWFDHPVVGKIVSLFMRDRSEIYHETFNDLNAVDDIDAPEKTVTEAGQALKNKGLSLADRIAGKESEEYQQLKRFVDYFDTAAKRDPDKTDEQNLKACESYMRKNGATDDVVKVWRLYRASYDKALEIQTRQFRNMIDKLKEDAAFRGEKADVSELKRTLKYALAEMEQWKGYYAPRLREAGDWKVQAYKEHGPMPENREYYREHKGSELAAQRLAKKLEREGWKVYSVGRVEKLPESIYQDVKSASTAKLIDQALEKLTGDANTDRLIKFNDDILRAVADEIRARGFRSTMIHRKQGAIIRGYIEDPIKRHLLYTNNMAGGIAKSQVALRAFEELMGQMVMGKQVGGLDPVKDPEAYKVATSYMEEQLRNLDATDRVIGLAKSIATFKFLGFNIRSLAVNMTALVTTAPAAIHQYVLGGKGSMMGIMRELGVAGKDFGAYMAGRKLGNAEEQFFLEEMHRKGWDDPQYTRDALGTIAKTHSKAWSYVMDGSMYLFGQSEKFNRGATILAAYRLARKSGASIDEAKEKAQEACNKAHGVYGKATMPMWAQGTNPAAKIGQMMYVYTKFSHNYLQMLYDIWLKKHNIKGAMFAFLSPLVVAGGAALPFKGLIFGLAGAILSALGWDDDPEKWVWDQIREHLGGGAETVARHGLTGAAGVDISSSLSIGVGVPKGIMDLTGAIGGSIETFASAFEAAGRGEASKAMEALLPTGISNPIKAYREAHEGVSTKRNYPVWDENGRQLMPTGGETAKKFFGFRSARQAVLSERTWEGHREQANYTEQRNALYQRYRSFVLGGSKDRQKYMEMVSDIREYNRKARENGAPLITTESLKSQTRRMQTPSKREKAIFN